MAAIKPDNHRVWPFWVRQDGSCWFIAFHPCQLEKTRWWIIPTPSTRSAPTVRKKIAKKIAKCELLHKGLRRPALNRQYGSGNPPIIACRAFGHPHRLCLDRDGHGRRSACAGLSHPDLTAFPFPPDACSRIFSMIAPEKVHPVDEIFDASADSAAQIASSAPATHSADFPNPIV